MSYNLSRLTKIFAAAGAVAVMSAGTAQAADPDTAYVPFVVNANAQVIATPAEDGGVSVTMDVTASQEKILKLTIPHDPTSIKTRGQQDSRPAITTVSRGKIMLNLPAQSYQHADVSLYSINGKLVTRGKASVEGAVKNISRSAVASGLYLLSVKGTDGSAFTSRVPHQGGTMDINVSFGGGASLRKSAAETFPFNITVSAAGYVTVAYTLDVSKGMNGKQIVTLAAATYTITFDPNGGTVTPTSGTVIAGGTFVALPTPTRGGYTFNGWFTAATGGTEVTVNTAFTADATIYAQWSAPYIEYGGQNYRIVTIGTQTWMAENLNYETENSWCYYRSDYTCDMVYGRLYTWEDALTVCPTGWHLPSETDWITLIDHVNTSTTSPNNSGSKLKSLTGWTPHGNTGSTDEYGFSALPGGMLNSFHSPIANRGERGIWWTATEHNANQARFSRMDYEDDLVTRGADSKGQFLTVRCVKD